MKVPEKDRWEPWAKRGEEVKSLILEFLKGGERRRYSELLGMASKRNVSSPTLVKHLKKLVARGVVIRDEVTSREVYYRLGRHRISAIYEMALIDFKNRLIKMLNDPENFDHHNIIRYIIQEGHNLHFSRYRGAKPHEGEFVAVFENKIVVARFDDHDWTLIKEGLDRGAVVGRFSVTIQSH